MKMRMRRRIRIRMRMNSTVLYEGTKHASDEDG